MKFPAAMMNATGQAEHRILHRRKFLGCLGAATAVFLRPRSAMAQGLVDTKAKLEIGNLARRTDALLVATVRDGAEKPSTAVDRFQTQQREISSALSSTLNRLKDDQWLPLTSSRQFGLAMMMVDQKVRLVPAPPDVTTSVDRALPTAAPEPQDTLFDVLLTIFMDALGIKELGKVAVEILLGDSTIKETLTRIGAAVRLKQYGDAALEIERLLTVLVSPRVMSLIEAKLGRAAVTKILTQVAARFVPFIGWAYTATCLLVSIYHNRDKIAKLL